jgi:glutamate racemase
MSTNSIAVLDSGFGGLGTMRALCDLMPHENIIYFGDTAHLPYGDKDAESIIAFCTKNVAFLLEKKIKVLVIACHTACAAALEPLRKMFPIPIIAILEQGVEETIFCTRTQKIAIAGTRSTIASGAYQTRIRQHLPHAEIHAIACPLFVPIVEEGFSEHPFAALIVSEYLSALKGTQIDTLLLGCTHYPFLKALIRHELGDGVQLIDPALRCAEKTREILQQYGLSNTETDAPRYIFYVSGDPKKFRLLGSALFKCPIENVHRA